MLRSKGITYTKIVEIIKEKGYVGSIAALRCFVSKEKRIAKDLLKEKNPTELIDKKNIIKLLYNPIEKVKSISNDQLKEVMIKYPIIETLLEILTEFKDMLLKNNHEKLDFWITKVKDLKISELNSFINGLQNDYESILNAIKFDYSNGLAEGNVNKLKNIKRVMYGRNSFKLLRHKIIMLEKLRKSGSI
ncbi:MAG: transposase [Terrisporobacter sp.]|uniref:transposase n=1 Tax=Terrisporobacter sp. TaxID=1965305 RepID=UPI002FCA2CFB